VEWLADAGEADVAGIGDDVLSRRARHVITETARVHEVVAAMAADEWTRVGTLFTASHNSLRDDYEVSSPELDVAVEAALGAGALGARMTGAGFGGSAIALLPEATVEAVESACAQAFAQHGFEAPECFLVAPGRGAGRA
jgi:galactokinase